MHDIANVHILNISTVDFYREEKGSIFVYHHRIAFADSALRGTVEYCLDVFFSMELFIKILFSYEKTHLSYFQ